MKFYDKLVFRIAITILIPIMIISIIIVFLMYQNLYEITIENYTRDLEIVNHNYVEFIDSKLFKIEDYTKEQALSFTKNKFLNESELLEFTKNNIFSNNLIFASAVVFAKGKYNANSDYAFFYSYKDGEEIKQISFQDENDTDFFNYHTNKQQWWEIPSTTYSSGWTDPYYDFGASKVDMITYYQPFFIDNEFAGIITIDVSLKTVREKLLSNEKTLETKLSSELFIISYDSTIMYSDELELVGQNIYAIERGSNRKFNRKESLKFLQLAIERKSGKMDVNSLNKKSKFLGFYSPFANAEWTAITIIPYNTIRQNVNDKLLTTLYITIAFIAFLITVIIIIARLISIPIVNLSKLSLQIASGNYGKILDLNRKDEIGVLSQNFNTMQTEIKKREDEIIRMNEQLVELDIAKNKFLLLISHEIRTPLNGITGVTSILNDSIEDPELKEFIGMLEESVDRLDKFSRKALEITQMQTVGKQLDKSKISVNSIIHDIIDAYKLQADQNQMKINTDFSDDDSLVVVEDYFISSLDELMDNAIKFSHKNTEIEIRTFIEGDSFKISIANTGDIIPLDKKEEVTKAFGLAEKHIDKNIGLGLNYVQTFIDIHEASMNIESDVERTIITLCFKTN